ncbi:hypothetical protein ACOMHN_008978 [Nucella lapillus]
MPGTPSISLPEVQKDARGTQHLSARSTEGCQGHPASLCQKYKRMPGAPSISLPEVQKDARGTQHLSARSTEGCQGHPASLCQKYIYTLLCIPWTMGSFHGDVRYALSMSTFLIYFHYFPL